MLGVLVTGATGFIGSHLTRRLVQEGYDVGILKRPDSDTWRIGDIVDDVTVLNADLRDIVDVSKTFRSFRPDVVFHLAAYYVFEHRLEDIRPLYDTNVLGTLNLLDACKNAEADLFVNTSTFFVYGNRRGRMGEGDVPNPLNLYALTKMHAEQACDYYAEKFGLKCVTLRLFPPYGPMDNERKLIPSVIKAMLEGKELKMTSGKQQWDFVYVDDIVDTYDSLIPVPDFVHKHETINIGTGRAHSIRSIVSMIKDIIGSNLEPEWGAVPHRTNDIQYACADIGTATKYLKWRPKTSLRNGLAHTVDYYKKEGVKGNAKPEND